MLIRWRSLVVGIVALFPSVLCAQHAQQAPVHSTPVPAPGPPRGPPVTDMSGRYEHTDPMSGKTWTLVLEPDGRGTALVNGQPARDSAGALVTFRYRVVGAELYVSMPHSPNEQEFGTFSGATLTTQQGWRYDKR